MGGWKEQKWHVHKKTVQVDFDKAEIASNLVRRSPPNGQGTKGNSQGEKLLGKTGRGEACWQLAKNTVQKSRISYPKGKKPRHISAGPKINKTVLELEISKTGQTSRPNKTWDRINWKPS